MAPLVSEGTIRKCVEAVVLLMTAFEISSANDFEKILHLKQNNIELFRNSSSESTQPLDHYESQAARIQGEIIFGGLFPVHQKGAAGLDHCGEIMPDRGIQRLEAMLFAIDEINRNGTILPGITIGATIFDTCSTDTHALEQSLEYVRGSLSRMEVDDFWCEDNSTAVPKSPPAPVAGVIGGSYSSVSIQVANLLRLFKIPQISYASTSAALSDKVRFDFFARTVPPDKLQAKALVDIVTLFNWTYISAVGSDGDYGQSGIDSFLAEARTRNICIATTEKIPASATDKIFDDKLDNLLEKTEAKAVILFLRGEDARGLLSAATRKNVTRLVWIASDGWGTQVSPVQNNGISAQGALTIELQSNLIPEFDEYFLSLDPMNNTRNPWFKQYWEMAHGCVFKDDPNTGYTFGKKECTGYEVSGKAHVQETKVPFVYDAVYSLARALGSMMKDECGVNHTGGMCAAMKEIDGHKLFQDYILKVEFLDSQGSLVQFDANGDGLGRYNILNYRQNTETGEYEYHVVGHWHNGINLNVGEIVWNSGTLREFDVVPSSECSQPCKEGEIKKVKDNVCCWICTTCAHPWEYLASDVECEDCGEGYWPYPNKTACYRIPEQYMQWDSVYAIVPMSLAVVAILITIGVIGVFIKHNDTPVVRASGRELCYLLLSGCLICYLMTFVLLAKPSTAICSLQRFGVGFGFAIIYASLLTKTNRIYRIFNRATKSAKRPAFISPRSQVVIAGILIGIQVMTTCIWLALEPPGTRYYFPNGQRDEMVLKCKIEDYSFLISLSYIMLLIIVCTVYAVKTRNIPENFNESKFIGFTMYTTCIIWLAFVPIYFGTLNSFEFQMTTLCISVSLSATVAIACLFLPKLHVILLHPEKNIRSKGDTMKSKTKYSLSAGLLQLQSIVPLTTANCKDNVTTTTQSQSSESHLTQSQPLTATLCKDNGAMGATTVCVRKGENVANNSIDTYSV
ncbi:metabotropic glutamate receptor 3 [Lingula anatina]|uniref:Metabotropic glutamate receptor 3 n=1 Tax=Lingula anatina TaxID=7574 RepID=A0A1S3I1F5_LINAN|nr:metabotropic glutamate receptor 3 [Lingula anatina]|eukprot:XP_013392097.2 metabotropic glutamate receptor 3 [Lingula anatina]